MFKRVLRHLTSKVSARFHLDRALFQRMSPFFAAVAVLSLVSMFLFMAPSGTWAQTNVHQPSSSDMSKSPSLSSPISLVTGKAPLDIVASAKIGTIHNPYTGQADKIAEGRAIFFGSSCNGCHGGGGGGGICPSIKNDTWVYGSDDDTLFRLISLGSDGLQAKGYVRVGMETVVAPMPPFGGIVKSDGDLFKLLAFVRSLYTGHKDRINW